MRLDPRSILSIPFVHDAFQRAVGREQSYRRFISRYVQPEAGMALLDIGCGTGQILEHLPGSIVYKGYDISPEYIVSAQKKYGSRASFAVGDARDCIREAAESYERVITTGLLHHMDDASVASMMSQVSSALKHGGKFISLDGVYVDGQPWLARRIIDADRGSYVRSTEQYLALLKPHFGQVEHVILHDMLRIPYTLIIMIAEKS